MTFARRALVTGAGGFLGQHLVTFLVDLGYWVRGADLKYPDYGPSQAHDFSRCDLRRWENCSHVTRGVDEVYNLSANMGGIGFITANAAAIVRDNTLIDINLIESARVNGVERYLYASSACVYPLYLQQETGVAPLREEDAYPADAEDGYGWEKLYMERVCQHYREEWGLQTRIARLHNVYGPLGEYKGGREKSPAALCRKIALACDGDEIEVWGDGKQCRSYCYVTDCVDGLHRLMRSDYAEPLNIGQTRLVSINELIDIISAIAGKRIGKRYNPVMPQGVRGRSSDNTTIRHVLGWEPTVPLETGMARTYEWIAQQAIRQLAGAAEDHH
jgi:GDP-D-mannose 3', 5'-epimerase